MITRQHTAPQKRFGVAEKEILGSLDCVPSFAIQSDSCCIAVKHKQYTLTPSLPANFQIC